MMLQQLKSADLNHLLSFFCTRNKKIQTSLSNRCQLLLILFLFNRFIDLSTLPSNTWAPVRKLNTKATCHTSE